MPVKTAAIGGAWLALAPVMFTYVDVSSDPQAFARSRVEESTSARAKQLGFRDLGYVESRPNSGGGAYLSRVMVSADGATILSASRVLREESWGLHTLLSDGTVVSTERRPSSLLVFLTLAVGTWPRAKHRYRLGSVAASSLDEVVEAHAARVRVAASETGASPFVDASIETEIAIRRRWREIADPRQVIANFVAKVAAIAAPLATMGYFVWQGRESPRAMLGAALGGAFVSFLAAIAAGALGLLFVGPLVGRYARVRPPPSRAEDLLELARDVRRDSVAPPGEMERARAAASAPIEVSMSLSELARAKRVDRVLIVANAIALPVLALVCLAVLGVSGWVPAIAAVFAFDGGVALVSGQSRQSVLRAWLVPAIHRATTRPVCTGVACFFAGRRGGAVYLALGVLGAWRAPQLLAATHDRAPLWLVAEWAAILAVSALVASSRAVREHRRMVPST